MGYIDKARAYWRGQAAVVRTNLASNPNTTGNIGSPVAAGTLGWTPRWYGGSGGAGNTTKVSAAGDGPVGITSYIRKTWTVIGTPGDTGFTHSQGDSTVGQNTAGFPVVPGQIITLSCYLRPISTNAGLRTGNITMFFRDAAGNFISGPVGGQIPLPDSQWTRLSLTGTAPAGAAYLGVNTDPDVGPNWLVGDTLDGTGLLAEFSSVLGTYFDGATTAAGDLTYGWVGAANNSQSKATSTLASNDNKSSTADFESTYLLSQGATPGSIPDMIAQLYGTEYAYWYAKAGSPAGSLSLSDLERLVLG